MFATITKLFAARTAKLVAKPAAFKPGMTTLEARDCPATFTIDHPGSARAYTQVNAPLFTSAGPQYTDVVQGQVGDCWLEAGLAEVAARSPNTIRNMFTDRGAAVENGVNVRLYDVRLYDTAGNQRTLMVDTMLPAGGSYYGKANGSLWAALAEKAYVQANGKGYVMSQHRGVDSYSAIDGGYGSWSLQAITGRRAGDYGLKTNDIGSAWNAGQYVLLGTPSNPASGNIVGGHEYAVVGYNPSSSQPYKVYNPWGTGSNGYVPGTNKFGLFTANAAFIAQNYNQESFTRGEDDGSVAAADFGTGVVIKGPDASATTRAADVKLAAPAADAPAADTADRLTEVAPVHGHTGGVAAFAGLESDLGVLVG